MRILRALVPVMLFTLWSASASANSIYAIAENGDMLFYKHTGTADGSATWPIEASPGNASISKASLS